MNTFKGKKLLILGGAPVHLKLIRAAQEMGAYVIVTDNVDYDKSPGKKLADEYWDLNIYDVEAIVTKSQKECIDGVVSGWLDPCQRPYQLICDRLCLPCYGNKESFYCMTDKHAFKKKCAEFGVDTITEFTEGDIKSNCIEFPVFVKPVDSRGSRGQAICNSYEELDRAIMLAEKESTNGDVIIEKYLAEKNSFQATYFFVDGEAYLIRTADGYKGLVEDKLDKVALCSISPSIYQDAYIKTANNNVIRMLKSIGLRNGPAMVQGFYDDGKFRLYDPGLRFPGVEYDLVFKALTGIDLMKEMVRFSVTGKMDSTALIKNLSLMEGKYVAVLFPTIEAGIIDEIGGLTCFQTEEKIKAVSLRYNVGDKVEWTYNVNQRVAEIDLYEDSFEKMIDLIRKVQAKLIVRNTEGKDMIYKPLDLNRILKSW